MNVSQKIIESLPKLTEGILANANVPRTPEQNSVFNQINREFYADVKLMPVDQQRAYLSLYYSRVIWLNLFHIIRAN